MISEYDSEPVKGLPERLPANETILWQGAPEWFGLARSAFHVRKVAIYFVALGVWCVVSRYHDGGSAAEALAAAGLPLAMGVVALALLCGMAALMARSTVYTITSRRVVFRFGVAFPMTVNVPFSVIDDAAMKRGSDDQGDLSLGITDGQRVSYLIMWPHVRPWRMSRPQPMLRAINGVEDAARCLADALSAQAEQARVAVPRSAAARPSAAAGRDPASLAAAS